MRFTKEDEAAAEVGGIIIKIIFIVIFLVIVFN